ncbi:MAG: winged helix-turn-helix domain-containing protein [Roseococcus sp.]|nr:winged helix-turn-helix domain-containing protein [Roseococcus sp.]
MSGARLSLRVDLPGGRIGPGKIALLEAIGREGSISAAGRALGMSYKRAWELVDQLNTLLSQPVVAVSIGGSRGGGARLTEEGEALIADYRAMEQEVAEACAPRVAAMMGRLRRG